MAIPPIIVQAAKRGWNWQWNQLMNKLAPCDQDGNYLRPNTRQKQTISIPSISSLKIREKSNLPILIIGRSCPWAHRTWLIYQLKGLKTSIKLKIATADQDSGRWVLNPPSLGCKSLSELYKKCKAPPTFRATVPLLVDPGENGSSQTKLIGNESLELMQILNNWPINNSQIELFPTECKKEIKNWQAILQQKINNGVYRCGFARNQNAYDSACNELFYALNQVEKSLREVGPWLCGEKLTIADIMLFPTLIRWEVVYEPLFRCSKESILNFPKIMDWRKRLFKNNLIESTCDSVSWRNDYYGALFPLNPSNIIPLTNDLKSIVNYQSMPK